mgnify:FL=1
MLKKLKANVGLLSLFLATFIWGATYVVTKIGLDEMGPNTLGFYRGILGSAFLVSVLIFKGQFKSFFTAVKKQPHIFALIGFIGITLSMIAQNIALTLTTSALFSIILATTSPIFIALISVMFLKEKLSSVKITGLVLGFIGVAVILFNKDLVTGIGGTSSLIGQLLSLATSFVWAIYSIQNKHYSKDISAIFLTTGAYIFGTLFLAPVSFIFETPLVFMSFSAITWAIILFLGIASAGLAFYLWSYGFSKVEASKAGMFMYLIPVISLSLGWLLLDEVLTAQAVIGSAIILGGVLLVEKNK